MGYVYKTICFEIEPDQVVRFDAAILRVCCETNSKIINKGELE